VGAVGVAVAASGCLAILDVQEDGFHLEADGGGEGGDDDGGSTGRPDASIGADGAAGDDGGDAGEASDAPTTPPDLCAGHGWHRDCTFGDGGFYAVSYPVLPSPEQAYPPAATADALGNVYAFTTQDVYETIFADTQQVTVSVDGGVSSALVGDTSFVVDVRALPNGELAFLSSNAQLGDETYVALRVDGGVVTETVGPPTSVSLGTALRLLDVTDDEWRAGVTSLQHPAILDCMMAAGTCIVDAPQGFTPGEVPPTTAIQVDSGAWFTVGADAGLPYAYAATVTDPLAVTYGNCTGGGGFMDLSAVDDVPVAVAPSAGGFSLLVLGSCGALASYSGAYYGDPAQMHLAHGDVGSADALTVVGAQATGGQSALLVVSFSLSPDAGADAGAPLRAAPVANGATSAVLLGSTVTLGTPVVVGGFLYVPFLRTPQTVDAGAGLDTVSVGEFDLLRLVYTP
jgi:hypothetical protein